MSLDVGNIIWFEHINLNIPAIDVASDFYFAGLGLTRDPFQRVGSRTVWGNCGRQQIHMPVTPAEQVLRGRIFVDVPDLEETHTRLVAAIPSLTFDGSKYSINEDSGTLIVVCPFGNTFIVRQSPIPGRICIPKVEFLVSKSSIKFIADVYKRYIGATVNLSDESLSVVVGPMQTFEFIEVSDVQEYDGHHVCVYVADFTGSYSRLSGAGLIWENPRFNDKCSDFAEAQRSRQYRFKDFPDESGNVVFELEHEVRSIVHNSYQRVLVNQYGNVGLFSNQ